MPDRRDRLARRIKACGYSHEDLADLLHVDRASVSRWVRGIAAPQAFLWPKLASKLKVTPGELEQLLQPDPPRTKQPQGVQGGDSDDVIRRNFLQVMAVTATAAALPATPAAHALPAGDADGYRPMNDELWKIHDLAASKRSVYPLVHDQAVQLATALRTATTEKQRVQLCGQAGNLYQLAGEILFDSTRYTDAAHCYTLAATAAREAKSPDLWACALTRHAYIGLYGDQRHAETVPLLSLAEQVARRGDTQLSTRYWVSAVKAEAYAGIGDLDNCRRALDEAEEVHALNGAVHNGGWLRFDGSRLDEERGTCYAQLGRPDLAETALNHALDTARSPRRHGSIHTDLALLGTQRRDIDQITTHARQAIEITVRSASGYVARRLHSLQPKLAPFLADHRIREINDQITELTAASTGRTPT
ncbi:helix-turn-helix domain-containing protein [Streptomyces boninensis]|uniref:helix-turn-helix domain-containing protein n=1 Tax=Streptomyces boninensis TaxID=2039455 RepID=UPI003B2110B3